MTAKKEAKLRKVVELLVQEAKADIKDFATDLLAEDALPAYTFEWKAQKIMFQSKMLLLAGGLLKAFNNPDRTEPLTKMAEWRIQESEKALLGNDIFSGEGPWRANSTCPIVNLLHIEEANAHRILRFKLKEAML